MENNNWKLASDSPTIGEDYLIYSVLAKGFAVGRLEFNGAWINSTNGMPFPPNTVTHYRPLPDAPALTGLSGYESYTSVNN